LYTLLATDLAIAAWAVIILCAVAYALNHLSFGPVSAISKLPSGLLYVWLFYVSGLSVAVVIVAHAAQNLTLLGLSRRDSSSIDPQSWLSNVTSWRGGRRPQEDGDPRWR
jgi:membrane protease YdiL (CAAX protease family)